MMSMIEVKQRAFDNKFVIWEYMIDPSFEFNSNEDESELPLYVSRKWIMTGVFKNEKEAINYSKKRRGLYSS